MYNIGYPKANRHAVAPTRAPSGGRDYWIATPSYDRGSPGSASGPRLHIDERATVHYRHEGRRKAILESRSPRAAYCTCRGSDYCNPLYAAEGTVTQPTNAGGKTAHICMQPTVSRIFGCRG